MPDASSHPSRQRPLVLSSRLIVLLAGLIGALLFMSTVLELRSIRRELMQTLDEQGQSMMAALQKAVINATLSFDLLEETLAEKLLSTARLLEELDAAELLTPARLQRLSAENGIHRANLFDEQGNRVMSTAPPGAGRGKSGAGSRPLLHPLMQGDEKELLLGFRQGRFGSGERFAVARKRSRGGVLVLNIDAAEMLAFRQRVGAGKLLRDIGQSRGVVYALLQDSSQVLLASDGVEQVDSLPSDPFLLRAAASPDSVLHRLIPHADREVYEVVQALVIDGQPQGVLRIGLSSEHLASAEAATRKRAILTSILLLVIGVVVGNGLIGAQNYRALQSAYRRIETYTGSILQNMTEAVIAVDRNMHITLANEMAERFFGRPANEMLGLACEDLNRQVCAEMQNVIADRFPVVNRELTLELPSGNKTAVLSIAYIDDAAGNIETTFAVLTDVSEQKILEQDLKRRDQLSAMGHLASGVAHEIRNPLNAISMIAQRFRSEFSPKEDAEEYDQLTKIVVSESRRIDNIIQQFLQFARPAPLNLEAVDVSALINDVLMLLGPEARAKQIELRADCAVQGEGWVDRSKMQQVLLNLLRNGIDACSAGDRVELTCARENDELLIRVRDSGAGMEAEQLQKIFNLYYTSKEKGTGLGLSIVQQIVSQHGGTIRVESEKGRGTQFFIQIPEGKA